MLIETEYLSNSRKLVVSYVDKSGEIKLKYFDWETPMKYVSCDENDPLKHGTIGLADRKENVSKLKGEF